MDSSRRRITGRLDHCPRGLAITTDAGDLWVLEHEEMDADLIGQLVTAKGVAFGYDRLRVEWIGEAQR